ncbi:MAG: caspase family protein [Anaerolineae bacterium]|nr:caspase family protein [Anaerolineae bacterium]
MSKRIALVIDNRNFQDPLLAQLSPPAIDSQALTSVLSDPLMGNFNSVELLLNPTVAQLRYQINRLLNRRNQLDVLLLYYLGPALIDADSRWYLAAADTRCDTLKETAVSAQFISSLMDRSLSHQQILVLDSPPCRLLAPNAAICANVDAGTNTAFKGNGYGRVVLTANNTIDYHFKGHTVVGHPEPSVFTLYLVEGLRTGAADSDNDGQIGVEELYEYVCDKVIRHTAQKPRIWSYQAQDRFVFGRNPREIELQPAIKWDLIFGAIMAPIVTVFIGGIASVSTSVGLAGLFLLMYAFLYWTLD